MAISRKQLRDGVKSIVETALPSVFVSTNRIEDIREHADAVLVTLESVDADYQLDGSATYDGQLNLRYTKQGGSDDELDTAADTIESAIEQNLPALIGRRSSILQEINYENFESSVNTITLVYRVRF